MSMPKTRIPIFDSHLKEAREYWVKKLSGERDATNLRPDFARGAGVAGERKAVALAIPGEVSRKLSKLTNGSSFLAYTTLLAALKICLSRYTNSDLIVVGSPARSRENDSLPAINALAIVDRLDGRVTFRKLLMRMRETLVEAYAYQSYPFDRVVNDLRLPKPENRCPLFDVALTLKEIHGEMPDVGNDITLIFHETAGTIAGAVEYKGGLFRAETIERFAGHFVNLLQNALDNIDAQISDLEILSTAEKAQLLFEWNKTAAEYPEGRCIHELFEAQVRRAPEAVALVFGEEQLSYGELDARANQVAHYLKKSGIGRESLVGIMMERGIETIVALLGTLKAGGAYVPLDPAYPQERLSFMLEDAQVSVLLTQARLLPMAPWSAARPVCIDSEWETVAGESVAPVESGVRAANTAYVIYTSGSTGQPKGVMVAHQGLSNMVTAQVETFGVHAESRILQFASLSFDASISEIFMALTSGAALCLGRQESLLPGPGLIELLREQRVTIVTLPPSVLAVLPEAELPDLTTITVAGEACAAELVARWAGGRQFFNLYGPTEATVWATVAECREGSEKPPIGRPILNTQGYILNAQLEPAPIGVAGELHLGGVGLARGYLNRPELTAERFIPNPFSQEAGARLYKTGDLARYHADGQIEFLGRIDHQVKLRGYRIELGEIETALNAHPAVQEAVALLREDSPAEKRLVAYLVSAPGTEPTINEMREYLQERLPNYMIPTSFVHLDALPLTTNGKVDRRALPLPDGYHPELKATYAAPRSEIERAIAAIWLEALKIEKIDIHDNFFNLGGHSVLLAQVHSRLQQAFDQKLTMIDLFKYPTIETLARYLSEKQEQQQPALNESHERAESRRELLIKQAQMRQGSHRMQGTQDE